MPLSVKILARYQYLTHFPAVSAGVHKNRAAERAGYAVSKFKTGERRSLSRHRKQRKRRAALGMYRVSADANLLEFRREYDRPAETFVGKEDIRSAAADKITRSAVLRRATSADSAQCRPARQPYPLVLRYGRYSSESGAELIFGSSSALSESAARKSALI